MSVVRTLHLTEEGIEVPEALRGFTGRLHVETPAVDMTATIERRASDDDHRDGLY